MSLTSRLASLENLTVMSILCTPLFFWAVISINNQNRQKMFREDPRDQIACGQMIACHPAAGAARGRAARDR